jgi:hypothetical protein
MEKTEQQLLALVAADRLHMPVSSMVSRIGTRRKNFLADLDLGKSGNYDGERVYARTESEDLEKARGTRDGIDEFAKRYPKYGKILNGLIEEKRTEKETHLYFGMNEGSRLTKADYMSVMNSLDYAPKLAEALYGPLMELSRDLAEKRITKLFKK